MQLRLWQRETIDIQVHWVIFFRYKVEQKWEEVRLKICAFSSDLKLRSKFKVSHELVNETRIAINIEFTSRLFLPHQLVTFFKNRLVFVDVALKIFKRGIDLIVEKRIETKKKIETSTIKKKGVGCGEFEKLSQAVGFDHSYPSLRFCCCCPRGPSSSKFNCSSSRCESAICSLVNLTRRFENFEGREWKDGFNWECLLTSISW